MITPDIADNLNSSNKLDASTTTLAGNTSSEFHQSGTSSSDYCPKSDISCIGSHNSMSDSSDDIQTESTSQVFSKAPSCKSSVEGGANTTRMKTIDWSREARRKRKLVSIGDEDGQTHVTDYYSIVDSIDHLVQNNKQLSYLRATEEQPANLALTPMLKQVISNAERNAQRLPRGRRHPEVLKKFCTSLLIYAGPLAYNFLQENLSQALPCLQTIQRIVHSEYKTIHEGEFRFEELVAHISQHKAPSVVTIGEDATRVISRVEFDSETNRCVGFVLPLNDLGLPEVDSFLAISFDGIEMIFTSNKIAKYAYVYMAQPICDSIPSFCLAIIGTDNKFTAKCVLLRWKHILNECMKRNIHVLSVGGDGDSRLMRAMKLSVNLFGSAKNDSLSYLSPVPSLKLPGIPQEWKAWFCIEPSSLACVQDTVHIAVKLKSRLLKPSCLIPMGGYVAGIQHLRMLQVSFGKDEHGLRERDIDHKDKQNFNAVLNIIRASPLLQNIPDTECLYVY